MIVVLLRWWYTTGWLQVIHQVGMTISKVEHALSVSLLLRTLFAPWRRIISFGGKGIDQQIRAALDNIISRCIGSIVRLTVLLTAGIAILCCLCIGIAAAIIWPLLPPATLFFAIRSITG